MNQQEFSKNNSVLLTNICSISKFLNIQQTSVHSTNICSPASVDSVPALCLLLGGDCGRVLGTEGRRHAGQAVLGRGLGLGGRLLHCPPPCLCHPHHSRRDRATQLLQPKLLLYKQTLRLVKRTPRPPTNRGRACFLESNSASY